MNYLIDSQIQNIIMTLQAFNQSCKMAAYQNDEHIDLKEQKALKKIDAATAKYIKELEKIRK